MSNNNNADVRNRQLDCVLKVLKSGICGAMCLKQATSVVRRGRQPDFVNRVAPFIVSEHFLMFTQVIKLGQVRVDPRSIG